MITISDLFNNGFVECGSWNNRFYFEKNGFQIVEHNGTISQCDEENWSGFDENYSSIEELNNDYQCYKKQRIRELRNLIDTFQLEIKKLKNS